MITRHVHNKITWFDVLSPTAEEIREVYAETKIPTDFINDLTSPIPQNEVKFAKNVLKVTLDFPIVKRTDIQHPHEVKFIATKKHLITVRFEDITAIDRFSKEFEVLSLLKSKNNKSAGTHVFYTLLSFMYTSLGSKIDHLETRMQTVEENIFADNEKETLFEISDISRRTISFRHTLSAHQAALKEIELGLKNYFAPTDRFDVDKLQQKYLALSDRTTALTTILEHLRDTNNALLNAKQNEVMKILTIMAFITFPLTLFTSLFGMNTTFTPIVGYEHDFWVIIGIMVVVSVAFFTFFKYKRWM